MPELRPICHFDGEKMSHETNWSFLTRQKEALKEEIERQERKFLRCEETNLKLKNELAKVCKKMETLESVFFTFDDLLKMHDLDRLEIERTINQSREPWESDDDLGSEHSEGTQPEDLDGEFPVPDDDYRAMEALLFPTFASIIYDNKLKIYTVTLACKYGIPLRFNVEKKCKSDSETKVEDDDL
jgi:hypothetical protein